jgi:hypothetical protein
MPDGTQIDHCTLRWDGFPVTLLDYNKQIVCGGVFLLGLQTTEVFGWLLYTLHKRCGSIWQTLITDEDSALMSAVPTFQEKGHSIAPCVCNFHERTNVVKHIHSQHYPKTKTHTLMNTLNDRFSEESETEVMLRLDKMINEAPEMAGYLNKRVLPLLGKFATCSRG